MNKNKKRNIFYIILVATLAFLIFFSVIGYIVLEVAGKKQSKPADSTPGDNTTTSSTAPSNPSKKDKSAAKTKTSSTKSSKSSSTSNKTSDYAYAYAGFSPAAADMNSREWNLLLVNRDYILPDGYTPKTAEAVKGSGVYLDYRVAPYYQQMYDAALADGITLTPISGYRSYERQKNNFENRISMYQGQGMDRVAATVEASQIILPPGTSEHNAGLAMDIISLSESFESTAAYKWLDKNAAEYGFILRYPKDAEKRKITKITHEPWHWRYVGKTAAMEIKNSGQVLEEYLSN